MYFLILLFLVFFKVLRMGLEAKSLTNLFMQYIKNLSE